MYEKQSIIIEHISKTFTTASGQITALNDVNLSIGQGEFFSIVGPSGCGKTTLLRILADLETPSAGLVTMTATHKGQPLQAMVFQEQSVFPWLTIREKQFNHYINNFLHYIYKI